MKAPMSLQFLTRIALAAIFLLGGSAFAQKKAPSQNEKKYERLIYSVKGQDLYRAHCSACHGPEGKGDGPLASALKTKPADLTALSGNNGGRFPVERVRKFISGDEPTLSSHGSREMPVWGPIFHQIEDDQDLGNVRLQNLIKYLTTIQRK